VCARNLTLIVTNEAITQAINRWLNMANKRIVIPDDLLVGFKCFESRI
jgi:hypothetical protein